jgi:hypothetical protein
MPHTAFAVDVCQTLPQGGRGIGANPISASIQTTERSLWSKQDLIQAVNERVKIKLARDEGVPKD